ncbi:MULTISPECIES: hypothetical protein [Alcaligenes]|uniref:hypothetical protein n=1 Tax=Alcaligenes TaxID=507 RepID=UPI00202FC4A8|nr:MULTISPECIES: hypothetical protein [Alcaligenes]URW83916.1 hypothetical protein NBV64_06060 [Alcaligenes sp. DN25]WEA68754.1 hypothetical protein PWH35_06070 [Alcaligenes faecalis]
MATQQSASTSLAQARNAAGRTEVSMGFGNSDSFELMQRAAKLLSSSTLVPAAYRSVIEKTDRYGNVTDSRQNPNALANAVVALNMANRMGADPLMVMQNLYIVEGRPSWSSQWIIAAINGCGRFSPLRFDIKNRGKRQIEYVTFVWENRQRQEVRNTIEVEDKVCVAWAIEKETGERLESPPVSIEMAVKEGWYTKNGSKWQTMDEVMLRYRTASFFGKLYAPELLMGLQSAEEAQEVIEASTAPDGTIHVDVGSLRPESEPRAEQTAASTASESVTDVELSESKDQKAQEDNSQPPAQDYLDAEKVLANIQGSKDHEILGLAADNIQDCHPDEQERLSAAYRQRLDELDGVVHVPVDQPTQAPAQTRTRRAAADME